MTNYEPCEAAIQELEDAELARYASEYEPQDCQSRCERAMTNEAGVD